MREYVYYPGSFQPLALLTQEAGRKESWHYHCDPNGAPVRLTSLQGEIVWSEKTGVWGEKGEIYADRISNPLRFQGQYFDAERLPNLTYLSRGVPFLLLYIALSALFSNVSASAAS